MIAIVSSMYLLLGAVVRAARYFTELQKSNGCAARRWTPISGRANPLLLCTVLVAASVPVSAQTTQALPPHNNQSAGKRVASFLTGAAIGLAAHETGHVIVDLALGEKPGLKKVDFHGVPFFAITHSSGLPRRKEFTISSAGFWVQHAENEWLLHSRPQLRREQAPFAKGVFAFNVLTSVAYAGAAFGRTGPEERDTRGIAASARVDERLIGALLLAPALLDAWRYFHPDARWAAWGSRGVKIGMVVMIVR
jgi:hypothetical protein